MGWWSLLILPPPACPGPQAAPYPACPSPPGMNSLDLTNDLWAAGVISELSPRQSANACVLAKGDKWEAAASGLGGQGHTPSWASGGMKPALKERSLSLSSSETKGITRGPNSHLSVQVNPFLHQRPHALCC